ncbi:MAG: preprotein translocase subunit SecA, partial [Patescibacteria group bacterium]|nr:preprotein translocase subunit SecA [Patescibacteria group bacterium]
GTNNEFGFDYLRDNMVYSLSQMVQRSLHYAIVDEIDSILIDEARTPLIISAPAEESGDRYARFARIVEMLKEDEDYNIDEKMKAATLTDAGISKVEKILGMGNIYVEGGVKEVHHLEQALKAKVLFKRDRDYVVKDGEILIVDEFTGRLMPGRRYSEGLHQAIEAKEGVEVKKESQTMATITFQNLFRMYKKLSGMTGTAATEAEEFHKIYNLDTIVIPTNKPNIRKDLNDLIYRTEDDKFRAVIADVKRRHEKGQPVLIGTISIEKNEKLTEMMAREGLHPEMLNAKNHLKEAQIIAQAGRKGAITLATNMAGRGVDIILGGNPPDKAEQEEVKALGGLHVIGTERHESRRIDNQLRGRAGRQGDPGSSQFYVSTEDDLMRIFGGDRMKNLMNTLKVPADMPIENKIISNSIESAQKKVEGNNFDMRKHLVEYDDVINKQRMAIYARRREIIEISETEEEAGKRTLSDIILEMVQDEIEAVVNFHTTAENTKDWNIAEIYETMCTVFAFGTELKTSLEEIAAAAYKPEELRAKLITFLQTEIKERYKNLKDLFQAANLNFKDVEKGILIRSIDQLWVEHLETIDYLRRGIGLRGYGQRDPLVEYKKESYRLYQELLGLIKKNVAYSIFKTGEGLAEATKRQEQINALQAFANKQTKNLQFSGAQKEMQKQAEARNTIDLVRDKVKNEAGEKVGRNDPCPCGSGKKFKKCHGQ